MKPLAPTEIFAPEPRVLQGLASFYSLLGGSWLNISNVRCAPKKVVSIVMNSL